MWSDRHQSRKTNKICGILVTQIKKNREVGKGMWVRDKCNLRWDGQRCRRRSKRNRAVVSLRSLAGHLKQMSSRPISSVPGQGPALPEVHHPLSSNITSDFLQDYWMMTYFPPWSQPELKWLYSWPMGEWIVSGNLTSWLFCCCLFFCGKHFNSMRETSPINFKYQEEYRVKGIYFLLEH